MSEPIYVSPSRMRVLDQLLDDAPTNKVIAKRLHITINTVKTHVSWLLAATNTRDRTALVLAVTTGRVHIVGMCTDCRIVNGHADWCPRAGEAA